MDILKNFGVDPLLLAAQIVNFLIIFWLLKKYAYKPIFSMLEKRKRLIEDGVASAKKSEELLQKSVDEEKAILKKAQSQAQELIADAQKQAQQVTQEAEANAKVRVEKILADAKEEIARQTSDAQKDLAKKTARLAISMIEKSLSGFVDSKTQKAIVASATKKLNA